MLVQFIICLKKIDVKSKISNKETDILGAKKLILPGVGSFDTGMKKIKKGNILDIIEKKIKKNLHQYLVFV